MKKITVEVRLRVHLHMNDTADFNDIMDEMYYTVEDTSGESTIIDTEMLDYELQDVR